MSKVGQKVYVKEDFIIDYDTPAAGQNEPMYVHYKNQVAEILNSYDGSNPKFPVNLKFLGDELDDDNDDEQYSIEEFEKYFISQAEWREQQIDSILND